MNIFVCLIGLALIPFFGVEACTGIKGEANDGTVVHGRTLEFGVPVETSVVFIPRKTSFVGQTPKGDGKRYTSHYAMLGAIGYNQLAIMDGINEKGLAVGTFYFPDFAEYVPTTDENQKISLSPIDFPNWILSQFSSLDEVKRALNEIVIAPTISSSWGGIVPPFHYIVFEKSGACIVIEPVMGKLVIHDNPLGVFTNAPTFDWHMTNLRNYINLTANNASPVTQNGITLSPFGQGSGMVGLPGDFTPPSRFVRAAAFSRAALPVKNSEEAVFQTFHILNQFDIPKGIVRQTDHEKMATDYTMVTVVRDPNQLKYYFKTYEDQTIRMVSLEDFDKDSKDVLSLSTKGEPSYLNISSQLKARE